MYRCVCVLVIAGGFKKTTDPDVLLSYLDASTYKVHTIFAIVPQKTR